MVRVQVSVCAILVVWGLDYVRGNHQWNKTVMSKPISFDYKKGDKLNIKIILKNIPPEANNYALFYDSDKTFSFPEEITETQPWHGRRKIYIGPKQSPIEAPVKVLAFPYLLAAICDGQVRGIPSDKKIHFTNILIGESFTLGIQLLEGKKICFYKNIMYGKIADGDNSSAEEDEEGFEATCLNTKHNRCRIIADFWIKGKVVDNVQNFAEINCYQNDSRYTCEPTYKNLPPKTEHQWYQRDENDTFFGIIPTVRAKRTMYKFEIEKFDDKSTLLYRKVNKNEQQYFIYKNIENDSPKNYKITSAEEFSEEKEFIFTCSNFAGTQIGWIDPTGYRITTFINTNLPRNFNKADNGSMLCCLHYNITYLDRKSDFVVIERIVQNITLLIYKEAVSHDNGEAIPSPETPRPNSVETPPASRDEPTKNTNTLEPAPALTSTESPHNLTTPEPAGSIEDPLETHQLKDLPQSFDYTKYYIAMVSTAGAILFVSLIYVIVKKCTRKAQDPDETLQLETYASTNMVYAELDINPGKVTAAPTRGETTYAEIIGVLIPQNEYVKK